MLEPGKNGRYVISGSLLIIAVFLLAFHDSVLSFGTQLPGKSIDPSTEIDGGPRVGENAPAFTLPDTTGEMHSLSSFRGKPIVLGFFCGCNRCHAAAVAIAHKQSHGKLTNFIAVVAMDAGSAKAFGRNTGLHGTILLDPNDKTAEAYESDFCPRLWQITSASGIAYRSPVALEGSDLNQAIASLDQSTLRRGLRTQAVAHG